MNDNNDNNEQNRIDDIFDFLETNNKKMERRARWRSWRYGSLIKYIKKLVRPEYVFLCKAFKAVHRAVVRTGYWFNSKHQYRRDSVMFTLIAIAIYIYKFLPAS